MLSKRIKKSIYFALTMSALTQSTATFALVDLTCLKYEPAMVTLIGVLESKIYPGPPNFLSIEDGDEPETGYYIELKPPICTVTKQESWMLGHERISSVQLAVSKLQFNQLATNVGHVVTVKGTLFEAFDAHHHTPVLMDVQTFDSTEKRTTAAVAPEKTALPIAANSTQTKPAGAGKKAEAAKKSVRKPAKNAKSSKAGKASKQKKSKK